MTTEAAARPRMESSCVWRWSIVPSRGRDIRSSGFPPRVQRGPELAQGWGGAGSGAVNGPGSAIALERVNPGCLSGFLFMQSRIHHVFALVDESTVSRPARAYHI